MGASRIGRVVASQSHAQDPGHTAGSGAAGSGQAGPLGLITDWGGVLTVPVAAAITAWLEEDMIDKPAYVSLMTGWVRDAYGGNGLVNPIHALERGESTPEEFEQILAGRLVRADGAAVPAGGLLRRMFAAMAPVEPMYAMLRSLRRAGIRTAMLSNSWGNDYPRELFTDVFDAVVISSEVGMRKPERRIFVHALAKLGLAPRQCVFIDDVEANVAAARELGMTAVHHRDPDATAAAVRDLFGLA
jgi:putative hydrolase of the HAD superfamily